MEISDELNVVEILNRHVPGKQTRDGLTVRPSWLLASLGRICRPTSKRSWYTSFAQGTSLAFLHGHSFAKLDSPHFWDQMQALPKSSIAEIEEQLLKIVIEKEQIVLDRLLLGMSNSFTYIASTNKRCTLAQRGNYKQRSIDLRQLGLLFSGNQTRPLPLFHQLYQGNLVDHTIFIEQFSAIIARFRTLGGSDKTITLVFDQGNNSKAILKEVDKELDFVGSTIVFDRYQLLAKANLAVDLVRRQEAKERKELKSTRYLWLKGQAKLSKKEKEQLESLSQLNLKTSRAKRINAPLRLLWECKEYEQALRFLKKWYFGGHPQPAYAYQRIRQNG